MVSVTDIQRGFTLVEIALVLLVVSILLGYSVALFPHQQELRQYRAAETEMETIIEGLIAFAQRNGRLPCPDTAVAALDGLEDTLGAPSNDCSAFFGFLPGRTLGLEGNYLPNNVLSDPWGRGYGYAVSAIGGAGARTLVTANGIRNAGAAAVVPDLYLCDDNVNPPQDDTSCATTGGNEVMGSGGQVAAVIISLGRSNEIAGASDIELENLDNFNSGLDDTVYILSTPRSDYDDLVSWVPTNLLISKMIAAGQLP